MTEQVTAVFAIAVDGPCGGECFEIPVGYAQLLLHGHHYRIFAAINGVAQYRFVARA